MSEKRHACPAYPHFLHGADYNAEQWPREIWDEDMRLMKLANCNEMSVGIFSWAKLEPEEGVFDFSFMDEVLDKIYENGGRVILATPSGARPRWLAEKYPEVLRVGRDGVRENFRARHNHCLTSPVYREKVRIITASFVPMPSGITCGRSLMGILKSSITPTGQLFGATPIKALSRSIRRGTIQRMPPMD